MGVERDPGLSVSNQLSGGRHRTVLQIGQFHGDLTLREADAVDAGVALVSISPPVDRSAPTLHGRDELLAEAVESALRQDGSVLALHGTGGSGKTAVALELTDALRRTGSGLTVWWLDASDPRTLSAGFREVALAAQASVEEVVMAWSGARSPVPVVAKALARAVGWVLVVDNADDARALRPWLPALPPSNGAVVITTRHGATDPLPRGAALREVEPLGERHAVDMLRELAPDAGDRAQALLLARALGKLPLALHLAGRYLSAAARLPRVAGAELPADFDHYRRVFLDHFPQVDQLHELVGGLDEREVLARTWELSLELLEELGVRWARALLRWLSSLAQAPLPVRALEVRIFTLSRLFDLMTPLELVRTLAKLADFGLVDRVLFQDPRFSPVSTECVLVHPVIREANRHQPDLVADPRPYLALGIAVLDGMTSHLSAADREHLSGWAAVGPHCEHLVDRIAALGLSGDFELLGTKLTRSMAVLAQLTQAHPRAESLFTHALEVRTRHLGPRHPDVLGLRRDLAWLRWEAEAGGLAAGHESEFADLLHDCARWLGDTHEVTLACRYDLAWIYSRDRDDEVTAHLLRETVRGEHAASGRHGLTGLTAQIELVVGLCRRAEQGQAVEDGMLEEEVHQLLTMLDEVESRPELGEALPVPIDRVRATLADVLRARHSGGAAGPPPAEPG
ncbi:hypothetical protein [Actinosynnema sp.]|uniref:hypothetical protein n=1 Tax=Actinosynnema sp. TaxID=1872144 RepID=UPI003F8552B4